MIATYLFYDKATGKQSLYTTNGVKHCNVICFDGRDYILFESQSHGIGFRRIKVKNHDSLLRNIKRIESLIGIICVHITEKKRTKWFPLWIRSCNEVCRYMSGVDTGLTFNPTHLIKKLVKYDNKRNYEILYQWSRFNEQS